MVHGIWKKNKFIIKSANGESRFLKFSQNCVIQMQFQLNMRSRILRFCFVFQFELKQAKKKKLKNPKKIVNLYKMVKKQLKYMNEHIYT